MLPLRDLFDASLNGVSHIIDVVCGLGTSCEISLGLTRVNRGYYMSAHYISFFMKRVYYNDMKRALASFIFIIVNEFHKNDM